MKILLFGDKGQVGREIWEQCELRNIAVTGFDIDTLDITNRAQVESVFAKNSADIVINAAAYTAVDRAEDEPEQAYAVNREGVENLALACKKHAIPLLHISTDYVFSGEKKEPYKEDDVPGPLGIYGKSKLAGDRILMAAWQKHIILRVSWVFGKYGNNFVKTILRLAKERESLDVVGDQYSCPTPAADIARVLLEIAKKINGGNAKWGVYNYCGSPVVSWYDFASEIVSIARNKHNVLVKQLNKISTEEFPTKARRPKNSELVVEKIVKNYGTVRHAWIDYLKKVVDEVRI